MRPFKVEVELVLCKGNPPEVSSSLLLSPGHNASRAARASCSSLPAGNSTKRESRSHPTPCLHDCGLLRKHGGRLSPAAGSRLPCSASGALPAPQHLQRPPPPTPPASPTFFALLGVGLQSSLPLLHLGVGQQPHARCVNRLDLRRLGHAGRAGEWKAHIWCASSVCNHRAGRLQAPEQRAQTRGQRAGALLSGLSAGARRGAVRGPAGRHLAKRRRPPERARQTWEPPEV